MPTWTPDMESWTLGDIDMATSTPLDSHATTAAGTEPRLFAPEDLDMMAELATGPSFGSELRTNSAFNSGQPSTSDVDNIAWAENPYDLMSHQPPSTATAHMVDVNGSIPPVIKRSFTTPSDLPIIPSVLFEYPSLLLKDGFHTPLLPFSMCGYKTSDITSLPMTTMAISCAGGLLHKDSSRFVQRAMDSERHRLIKAYQWDGLHAMIIYEVIELRDIIREGLGGLEFSSLVPGLRFPFITKMARCYSDCYPELRSSDTNAFSLPDSAPDLDDRGIWHRWRITETARRTLFILNILNWCSYHDPTTGKQSPYYGSLHNDIVLTLPLPCSDEAWTAQNESEWRTAMQTLEMQRARNVVSTEADTPVIRPGSVLTEVLPSLQEWDDFSSSGSTVSGLHKRLTESAGWGNSEQLRCFIVLAACLQFPNEISNGHYTDQ
nr:hypothetical protein CFP56_56048 [Quercus suber]